MWRRRVVQLELLQYTETIAETAISGGTSLVIRRQCGVLDRCLETGAKADLWARVMKREGLRYRSVDQTRKMQPAAMQMLEDWTVRAFPFAAACVSFSKAFFLCSRD